MGWVKWLFARVERMVLFFAAVATIALLFIALWTDDPPIDPTPVSPPPSSAEAEIASRMANFLAANGCDDITSAAVIALEQSDRAADETSHGNPATLLQADIQLNDQTFTVQGNARGATSAAIAKTALIENTYLHAKELGLCD